MGGAESIALSRKQHVSGAKEAGMEEVETRWGEKVRVINLHFNVTALIQTYGEVRWVIYFNSTSIRWKCGINGDSNSETPQAGWRFNGQKATSQD